MSQPRAAGHAGVTETRFGRSLNRLTAAVAIGLLALGAFQLLHITAALAAPATFTAYGTPAAGSCPSPQCYWGPASASINSGESATWTTSVNTCGTYGTYGSSAPCHKLAEDNPSAWPQSCPNDSLGSCAFSNTTGSDRTYNFHCGFHPNITGTLIVHSAPAPTQASNPPPTPPHGNQPPTVNPTQSQPVTNPTPSKATATPSAVALGASPSSSEARSPNSSPTPTTSSASASSSGKSGGGSPLPWIVGAAVVLGGGGAALYFLRLRGAT